MIKLGTRLLLGSALALGSMTFLTTEASAQATRTWVSGVGDDANPCSRTAPCRTWAGAISKTAAGGEMDCLDPGGFGAVTITKSMTVICDWSDGGILVAGQNGIIVNDSGAGTVHVTISGLNIEGLGNSTTSPGIRGVWFVSGASLTVRNSTIRGFRDPSNGIGIAFTPSTAAKLNVDNVHLTSNGASGVGGGIVVQPTGASGSAIVSITNTRSVNNTNNGIVFNSTGNTSAAGITATVTNTTSTGNSGGGISVLAPAAGSNVKVVVNNSDASGNAIGIVTNGPKATLRVGNTVIANNTSFGVFAVGASGGSGLFSYAPASNLLNGNATDGTFTGTVPFQ